MSLRVRILQVDVPAAQLDEATTFWAAALDATPVRSAGGFVHLHDARSVVEVHLQPLDAGPARYHLDLEAEAPTEPAGNGGAATPYRDVEVARLARLGARIGARSVEGYTVFHDPAGLPMCVIDPAAAPRNPLARRRGDRAHLDAIFLDVPATEQDRQVAFWAAALGVRVGAAQDEYVPLVGVAGPGGPVDLEVQRIDGAARIHVDLSTRDVPAEAARLEALGATRVAARDTWITLAAPTGNLLCVVPTPPGA